MIIIYKFSLKEIKVKLISIFKREQESNTSGCNSIQSIKSVSLARSSAFLGRSLMETRTLSESIISAKNY